MNLISKNNKDEEQIRAVKECAITNFPPTVPTFDWRNYCQKQVVDGFYFCHTKWTDTESIPVSFSKIIPSENRSIGDQPKESSDL